MLHVMTNRPNPSCTSWGFLAPMLKIVFIYADATVVVRLIPFAGALLFLPSYNLTVLGMEFKVNSFDIKTID